MYGGRAPHSSIGLPMTTEIALVQTSLPDLPTAQKLARAVVETGDAACVQMTPIMSVFPWEGAIEEAKEFRLDIKTSEAKLSTLLAEVERLHPYDVPEIIVLAPISTTAAYGRWVETETQS